ncbi:type II toxin-antitoxin system VapB family antitoxin [Sphingomonas pituitosa]|uniref:type II toxin-antitoxin system VapB family antitoxin n=1 Tax=Sphingomonas pituitosa TaxID=99597 RepID=UPI0008353197|nr:type II toxin-antitoxin system VapB family antitoxin [Sphingomonas pituitosa]
MASLYIKDSETNERVSRLATRLGLSKTEAVRRAIDALEQRSGDDTLARARDWLARFDARFPTPEPREATADKAFFDSLSGDL